MKINREDMLELTRRMTPQRSCFTRIAGAYLDEEGFEDGSFNIHFLKLSPQEKTRNLKLAKCIPFAGTNTQLKLYPFPAANPVSAGMKQLLLTLRECALKNDAMLSVLYERIGEIHRSGSPCAVFVFHGSYDVPLKASDKEQLGESEEVYDFLILCLGPLAGEYEPGEPEWGFLFPAFTDRSSDEAHIAVFEKDPDRPHARLMSQLLGIS